MSPSHPFSPLPPTCRFQAGHLHFALFCALPCIGAAYGRIIHAAGYRGGLLGAEPSPSGSSLAEEQGVGSRAQGQGVGSEATLDCVALWLLCLSVVTYLLVAAINEMLCEDPTEGPPW